MTLCKGGKEMQLDKKDLTKSLQILAADAAVFVPGEVNEVSRYVLWDGSSDIKLDGPNTALPPKDILFPQTEKMYAYRMGADAEIKELVTNEKQVIFGIRPCDVRSIECMDRVFLEKGYVDCFYARKRDNVTIIAISCPEAGRTCFCDSMGIDPAKAPAADVMLCDAGDFFEVEAQTEKGKAVVESWKGLLKESGKAKAEAKTECTLKVKMTPELPKKLAGMFEDPVWGEVSKPCIGCATCTYVCPTCYCFDIDSENAGSEGIKFRCWDSCMFSDYTRMAGGHNPRPTKKERVRNRFMHKLSYFNERYGMLLCVGCGRCVDKCPAHIDITEFIDRAGEA